MNIEEMEARRVTVKWTVYGLAVVVLGLVAAAYSCEGATDYESCLKSCEAGTSCKGREVDAECIAACASAREEDR